MKDSKQIADFVYAQNNGTLSVWPTFNGKVKSLCKITHSRAEERPWTFGDPNTWKDEDGNERMDHTVKGTLCGNFNEGHAFVQLCRDLGYNVLPGGGFVPFSNGHMRDGYFNDGAPFNEYTERELSLMRWDLPTKKDLEELL